MPPTNPLEPRRADYAYDSTRRERPDALAAAAVDETIHWLRLDELFEPWQP